jgi:hypothetical protein
MPRIPSHPYWAGYRKPSRLQRVILVLSALAGFTVSGIYLWATLPQNAVAAVPAQRDLSSEESLNGVVCCVLLFGTAYATGWGLYRYLGDPEGSLVVSATAGQHMPLLLLLVGGVLSGRHGAKVLERNGRVVDWLMLATGLVLLALSAWGLYRAIVVHRAFYQRFYGSRKDRPSERP